MSTSQPNSQSDPGLIFNELNAYQRSAALKGAVDLDLFTVIDNGASTAGDIAAKLQCTARAVRMLSDFLAVHGLLTKEHDRYGLTPTSKQFLSKNSRAYMGSMVGFLMHPHLKQNFEDIAATVRRGGPPVGSLIEEEAVWVEFARAMAPMAYMSAEKTAEALQREGPSKAVLDIAASHGLFGIAVARRNPEARITAVDTAQVLEVARENAAHAGIANRHRLLPGSAFEVDFGSGYDLSLVTNFIHVFDRDTNITLLKRIRAAMAPGARIAIVEFVPNEDRVSPPAAADFALTMLVNTRGDTYTFTELNEILGAAGFRAARLESLAPVPQQLVIARC